MSSSAWTNAGIAAGLAAEGLLGGGFLLGVAVTWVVWLSLDLAVTRALGWPLFWRYPLAWTLRELLVPVMWAMTSANSLVGEKSMREYHLLPSVRGDFLFKLGRNAEARAEFERAASLTHNARERELLLKRAAACARR